MGTDAPRREAELERGLVSHIQKFLLALGQGFAFVGQQVHLELGDQDFYLDLLFYHLKLRCYVVLEIKARKFEVGDGAQLGMYMTAVDKLLKHPDDKPTLGLLLVRGKNEILVEYALAFQEHFQSHHVPVCPLVDSDNGSFLETIQQGEHLFLAHVVAAVPGKPIHLTYSERDQLTRSTY